MPWPNKRKQYRPPTSIHKDDTWLNKMAEQHEYGLVVANTSFSAKAKARKKWLHGLEKQHKDDLHEVKSDGIDQLQLIEGNDEWTIELSKKSNDNIKENHAPDCFNLSDT